MPAPWAARGCWTGTASRHRTPPPPTPLAETHVTLIGGRVHYGTEPLPPEYRRLTGAVDDGLLLLTPPGELVEGDPARVLEVDTPVAAARLTLRALPLLHRIVGPVIPPGGPGPSPERPGVSHHL